MLKRIKDWWKFRQALIGASDPTCSDPIAPGDVVVIPCWRRPEFLWHCLDNLTRADGSAETQILFRLDTGYSPDNIAVIKSFSDRLPNYQIECAPTCPFRRTKQSANVLLGYLHAARRSRRLVHLIEEDVMVSRDYFRWHRAVHDSGPALFCSIAVRNPNRNVTGPSEVGGYYLSGADYCSYGVCFDKHVLQTMIAPHVNMTYMRLPKKYLRRQFPSSVVGLGFVEQDGLIRRIQEKGPLPIAYPCVPRAFDAGFYGYNRPGGLGGSLQERIHALSEIIYDPRRMREAALRPEFVCSGVPIDLQTPPWALQRRIDMLSAPLGSAHA
jgi:hypothetical protein